MRVLFDGQPATIMRFDIEEDRPVVDILLDDRKDRQPWRWSFYPSPRIVICEEQVVQ